jgi:hypothetical protein
VEDMPAADVVRKDVQRFTDLLTAVEASGITFPSAEPVHLRSSVIVSMAMPAPAIASASVERHAVRPGEDGALAPPAGGAARP